MTERPRDRWGRPLRAGEVPGPPVPSIEGLDDLGVWTLGLRLLADDLPFHAHEVFEARWRQAPPAEREAWRACAQWAAARTHEARGNAVGAVRLAQRAAITLQGAPAVPAAIDAAVVRADCARLHP